MRLPYGVRALSATRHMTRCPYRLAASTPTACGGCTHHRLAAAAAMLLRSIGGAIRESSKAALRGSHRTGPRMLCIASSLMSGCSLTTLSPACAAFLMALASLVPPLDNSSAMSLSMEVILKTAE